jgi:hypothetical protein
MMTVDDLPKFGFAMAIRSDWADIPINIQAMIEPVAMSRGFTPRNHWFTIGYYGDHAIEILLKKHNGGFTKLMNFELKDPENEVWCQWVIDHRSYFREQTTAELMFDMEV